MSLIVVYYCICMAILEQLFHLRISAIPIQKGYTTWITKHLQSFFSQTSPQR